jgi:4-hydroxymandelate oxidase
MQHPSREPRRDGASSTEPARPDDTLLTTHDFEAMAKERLARASYDYYRSGADDELTLRRNAEAFERYEIRYRTFVDVSAPLASTTVLGSEVSFPILVAPTAYHKLACAEGEPATARAARDAGTLYVASTLATTSLEDVRAAAPDASQWFQLYVHRDREFTANLVRRAKSAGFRAIALTCDTPVLGRRLADAKNRFCLPDGIVLANLVDVLPKDLREGHGSELARFVAARHDPGVTWKDLRWLVDLAAPLPVVVKGIVRGDDALRALDHGAQAIWVSNHGGRQLDCAPATLDALVEVVRDVGARAEVYVDGGVRSGTQALVALGLGARAVFVGRPILWGLAVDAEAGVRRVLDILRSELVHAMRLAGCARLEDARDLVRRRG